MSLREISRRLTPGATCAARALSDVRGGGPVRIPDPHLLVHLQLRRFAGCPVCNLHLRSFVRRHDEITRAGVREVVVFHSTPQVLLPHVEWLPFRVIADPEKRLYAEFGAETSLRALLDPRVWGPIVRGVASSLWEIARGRQTAWPSLNPQGGRFGLPADLLIHPDGRVLAAKYGRHAYDQWSVDELLALAAQQRGAEAQSREAVAC